MTKAQHVTRVIGAVLAVAVLTLTTAAVLGLLVWVTRIIWAAALGT